MFPIRMIRARSALLPAMLAPVLAMVALAGCSQTDPYQRAGTWKPSGVNDANIAAQLANPADLVQGRAATTDSVRTSTGPVERLWVGAPQQQQRPQGQAQGGAGTTRGGGEAPR